MINTVKLFSFKYSIGNATYAGQIPALSWAEAESLVPFALVDGEIIEEHLPNACAICTGTIKRDLTHPVAIADYVWADVIGD